MPSAVDYVQVPLEEPGEEQRQQSRGTKSTCFSFMAILAALCIIATTCSVILSVYLHNMSLPHTPSTLRRPNQYINLDKINHAHEFPPITNFPDIVLQINPSDTQRIMKEDHRTLYTDIGTIHTDDRHVHITQEVSSIIQFRHLDFGMERCRLITTIPEYDSQENKSHNQSVVDVWLLGMSTEISRQVSGSWIRAPKRHKLLASPTLDYSINSVFEFGCRSNEFTTLEFSCQPASECHVDFWQDKRRRPVGGIHIIQESGFITRT